MDIGTVDKQAGGARWALLTTLLAIAAAIIMLATGTAGEVVVRRRLAPPQPTATPVATCPGPVNARGLPPQLQLEFNATCVERIGP